MRSLQEMDGRLVCEIFKVKEQHLPYAGVCVSLVFWSIGSLVIYPPAHFVYVKNL